MAVVRSSRVHTPYIDEELLWTESVEMPLMHEERSRIDIFNQYCLSFWTRAHGFNIEPYRADFDFYLPTYQYSRVQEYC